MRIEKERLGRILIEQIKTVLGQLGIDLYSIVEQTQESMECFFIRKKLDLKRGTDTTDYAVTVFHPFEKETAEGGVRKMLGSSVVNLHPGMEAEELKETLKNAYKAASLVANPYYELNAGEKAEPVPSNSSFAGQSLEVVARQMIEALYALDTSDKVFINSAEVFAKRVVKRIVNARGVDVSYETYSVSGEYVIQCIAPQDVETHHQFAYRDADTEALRREVEEALAMTQARAEAKNPPKAGEYTILLSGKHVRTVLEYYIDRASTALVYQKYSNYEIGAAVQGQEITGDALTITLKAKDPYSAEGIPMKDRVLLENGTLKTLHGGSRFAYYLGIEPTGDYHCISVPTGSRTMEELKAKPYLHVVSFSDFQMDALSGHFGGEIRLAFLYDGETVVPVTGGSINGSILAAQEHMTFSKERYRDESYEGPYAVQIEGIKVAGA